ncbi:MAG TPA: adenylate/guanylate cyclase domain-containing protein, partial [Rhizobiaceae bacterium]|nr:adenylate/guanylate cyclase domain-containing protein [Rhizobiaceae bacterium]
MINAERPISPTADLASGIDALPAPIAAAHTPMSTMGALARTLFRMEDVNRLPARVQLKIREREWFNEILLRTIQLLIILIFMTIYIVSPKTALQGTINITPYVLATYLVLSLFGLAWAFVRQPPDWASYVSVIFDFTLLYGLMVAFHIQYEQPASFILKAPALLYVFIFIAIRSLRLHPKFVIVAGMVAISGWALIIGYVTRIDPGDNMLTRSYVEYLTSNSILIGAEVDKILSIFLVTAILALAVNGSRNLLVTAVSEGAAAASFARFFDASVGNNIRAVDDLREARRAEKCPVSVMMLDIRGFSALAETLDGEAVVRILAEYRRKIVPLIEAHNGIVDKFMGDGIMTVFGVGEKRDNYAADAMRAVESILRLLPNGIDGHG